MHPNATIRLVHRAIRALSVVAAFAGGVTGHAAAEPKPLREWYLADLLRTSEDATVEQPIHGTLGPTLEWIILFNLSEREAKAEVTFFYEDRAPTKLDVSVPGGGTRSVGGHNAKSDGPFPLGKLHGARVRSDAPLIVQTTRAEQEHGVKLPTMPGRSFLSRLGYPGPLGRRETAWAYADCIIQRTNPYALELEWLTVLNPNPNREARVTVTFHYGAKKTTHAFTVGAERVRTIALEKVEAVKEHAYSSPIVRSDVPIVVDQVRRYWYRQHPAPAGTWIVTGYPVGDLELGAAP